VLDGKKEREHKERRTLNKLGRFKTKLACWTRGVASRIPRKERFETLKGRSRKFEKEKMS